MLEPVFENPIPYFRSRFSNRFGNAISLTSDSDLVGLAWYKFLARETHAGTYVEAPYLLEDQFWKPCWKPDLAHQRF